MEYDRKILPQSGYKKFQIKTFEKYFYNMENAAYDLYLTK